jgi:hypothetical protein
VFFRVVRFAVVRFGAVGSVAGSENNKGFALTTSSEPRTGNAGAVI